jgi:hypothetical protein
VVADAKGKHALYEELYEKIMSPLNILYLKDQVNFTISNFNAIQS